MKKYIYDRFNFSNKYKKEVINFVKNFSNAEMGGTKFYDGTNTHYMQNAHEIVSLIFELKKHEKSKIEYVVQQRGHFKFIISVLITFKT